MADSTKKTKTEAEIIAQKKYMEKYCEIKVRMTPEERESVKLYAQTLGMSASNFIKKAITENSGIIFESGKEEH